MTNKRPQISISTAQLSNWLDEVQQYPVSEPTVNRLSAVLTSVEQTVQAVNTPDNLFWTEPAQFESTLEQLSAGSDNE